MILGDLDYLTELFHLNVDRQVKKEIRKFGLGGPSLSFELGA